MEDTVQLNVSRKHGSPQEDHEDDHDTSLTGLRSYPRKRVAVACEVCRLRKTRCDAARPSCSFCKNLGIDCTYKGPSNDDRKVQKPTDFGVALKRLETIQSTLDAIAGSIGSQHVRMQDVKTPSISSTSPSSSVRTSKQKPVARMPNLFIFKPTDISSHDKCWAYDCTEDFFRHQLSAEDDLCENSHSIQEELNLSKPHLWRLQRSFVENVLSWLPLFDHDTTVSYLQTAQGLGLLEQTPDTCLVLLMYAVGALALDTCLYNASSMSLPGFSYYSRAMETLRQFPRSGKDLRILQCHILSSMYLLLAMRPLEAWKMIRQASQTCILLLKAGFVNDSSEYKETFDRAYWICYVLESELEISLELPSSGLRAYEDIVALPTSHYEEDGIYFLLAMSSLRKLMVEVVDTVGLRAPTEAKYAPGVTLELRNQIDDWYQHLPKALHFPSDHSMLFDMRRAYLRCMYYALIVVAFWPFVPRVKDISHNGMPDSDTERPSFSDDWGKIREGAEECLEASRNYLKSAEEILTQKSLVSHLLVRSYFTTAMILLLVYPDTKAASVVPFDDQALLTQAIQNLSHWDVVPFMQNPISEMKRIARLKGFDSV